MKKIFSVFIICLFVFAACACSATEQESTSSTTAQSSSTTEQAEAEEASEPPTELTTETAPEPSTEATAETSSETEDIAEEQSAARQISVQFGDSVVIYELNNGTAAASLYEQLPLTVEVEDYSNNEKIFYPPQELDTGDSPTAQAGAGTLAYYAPWGDVVMFYDNYNQNPSLYELGQAVSGAELVSEMSGTITITAVQ